MSKTAVIFSPRYYEHNTGKDHPESAKRLRAIIDELRTSKFSANRNWQFVRPGRASLEDVELVHGMEYIRLVEAVCKSGGGLLDLGDTQVSPESFEVALHAVGGTLKAVDLVMGGKFRNAFVLARPPGHHASKYRACGFCLFNNVAIAARYMLERFGLKRVLILDIDAHHGNGTQEIFYETDKVLFISLHEDPYGFPGTGFTDEIGEAQGLGYNVNIPLPFGTDDQIYLRAVDEIARPIILQYNPQFALVSAGFDGHHSDPVANLSLTYGCYQRIFETIMQVASEKCSGRVVSVLEGGYCVSAIGKAAAIAIARMTGAPYFVHDMPRIAETRIMKRGEKILEEVKKAQGAFWSID
jgi:acetoin utilization deacetylase AcuC-like enzyme